MEGEIVEDNIVVIVDDEPIENDDSTSINQNTLDTSSDNNNIISDQIEYEEEGNNLYNNNNNNNTNNNTNNQNSPNLLSTNKNNNNNNNVNRSNFNNNNNRNATNQQQQQQQSTKSDTIFDIVLQWGSLAISKLCFYPIEFPIHALTTFIQSNHSPPQPHALIQYTLNTLNNQVSGSTTQHQFLASSLFSLLKQKGYHIYDGGLVYLLHNMITILINFIQRSFNNLNNNQQPHQPAKPLASFIDFLISLLKYTLTLPLDVLMTRLIVHRFYKNDSTLENITFISLMKNEGIISGLYAGWEVVVLKSILESIYKRLDNHLMRSKRGKFSSSDKSPAQIILLGIKLLLDYMLSVIKVRLNIRNIGFLKTVKNIIRREGLRGLLAGLNVYFMLFPLWMISVLVANYIYLSLKGLIERTDISGNTSPPLSSHQNNNNNNNSNNNNSNNNNNNIHHHNPTTTSFDDERVTGMGVAITPLELSIEQTTPLISSPNIQENE
ncbi:mitochondrial substrate carrier family protein [Tieghemostelium lacteum]|uniref:Mitochondrial substrate carrier family protein n=1 Tax=Tieghemostelium lacteum TaxID=361077 RepID=A0A151ZJ41_TIELA|nr:mitochondrial substrate carrier family protein [Tieghemostelium lacteum]|eukprot:KYQ93925.1 mitochondrial substrate carrier family protein [Tieghemostelium lacteum]